jgi:hypothetical protein
MMSQPPKNLARSIVEAFLKKRMREFMLATIGQDVVFVTTAMGYYVIVMGVMRNRIHPGAIREGHRHILGVRRHATVF